MTYNQRLANYKRLGVAADELRHFLRANPAVAMVADSLDDRGLRIVVFLERLVPRHTLPIEFRGFPVVVVKGGRIVPHNGPSLSGGFLSKLISDPISAIVSAPATVVDAAAGGPQKRARTKAAVAAGTATQAQIDEERATREATIVAELARAQATSETATAAAKAAAKKKLITTLGIGGAAFAVLGLGLWLVTGKKKAA